MSQSSDSISSFSELDFPVFELKLEGFELQLEGFKLQIEGFELKVAELELHFEGSPLSGRMDVLPFAGVLPRPKNGCFLLLPRVPFPTVIPP